MLAASCTLPIIVLSVALILSSPSTFASLIPYLPAVPIGSWLDALTLVLVVRSTVEVELAVRVTLVSVAIAR
jgi:hypothetical protein